MRVLLEIRVLFEGEHYKKFYCTEETADNEMHLIHWTLNNYVTKQIDN